MTDDFSPPVIPNPNYIPPPPPLDNDNLINDVVMSNLPENPNDIPIRKSNEADLEALEVHLLKVFMARAGVSEEFASGWEVELRPRQSSRRVDRRFRHPSLTKAFYNKKDVAEYLLADARNTATHTTNTSSRRSSLSNRAAAAAAANNSNNTISSHSASGAAAVSLTPPPPPPPSSSTQPQQQFNNSATRSKTSPKLEEEEDDDDDEQEEGGEDEAGGDGDSSVEVQPRTLEWTKEEDELLTRERLKGTTYSDIAPMLPGRTPAALTGRWNRLKKTSMKGKKRPNPNKDKTVKRKYTPRRTNINNNILNNRAVKPSSSSRGTAAAATTTTTTTTSNTNNEEDNEEENENDDEDDDEDYHNVKRARRSTPPNKNKDNDVKGVITSVGGSIMLTPTQAIPPPPPPPPPLPFLATSSNM
jgi:hypothetical protein